jgi:hypothetical protein
LISLSNVVWIGLIDGGGGGGGGREEDELI